MIQLNMKILYSNNKQAINSFSKNSWMQDPRCKHEYLDRTKENDEKCLKVDYVTLRG